MFQGKPTRDFSPSLSHCVFFSLSRSMAYHPSVRGYAINFLSMCTEFFSDRPPWEWPEGFQWELAPCVGDSRRPYQHDNTWLNIESNSFMITEIPTLSFERFDFFQLDLTEMYHSERVRLLNEKYLRRPPARYRVPADVGVPDEDDENAVRNRATKKKK